MKDKIFFGFSAQDATFVIEYVKDFSPRRAAEYAGYAPDHGYELLKRDDIIACIRAIVEERMTEMNIDAEWLLYELVDNHRIARQHGNISASNTALGTIAKHVTVDALAKQKVDHFSSDGSMTPAPHVSADIAKQILKDLESDLEGEVSFI